MVGKYLIGLVQIYDLVKNASIKLCAAQCEILAKLVTIPRYSDISLQHLTDDACLMFLMRVSYSLYVESSIQSILR